MDTLEPNRTENVSEDTQNSPTSSKTNQTSQMQMDVEGMENAIYTLPCYKCKYLT